MEIINNAEFVMEQEYKKYLEKRNRLLKMVAYTQFSKLALNDRAKSVLSAIIKVYYDN
jgi:hypothetical protein